MAIIKAFKGIRPISELAEKIAALPYDVMSSDEARLIAKDNLYSFLHVDKAEIDLEPKVNIYDNRVYEKARDNLELMINNGWLIKDNRKNLYIYKQVMGEHEQAGLVCCLSVDDYLKGKIKKHEHTRNDKELDRINHVDYCNANTGPIFIMHEVQNEINKIKQEYMANNSPVYDFVSNDGIQHVVWVIEDDEIIESIITIFKDMDSLYIADGHHRAAAAAKVALKKREENSEFTGEEEFNYFLGVLFPYNELKILDYNRVVKDLNEYSVEEFLNKIKEKFIIEDAVGGKAYAPTKKHEFGMYLNNKWYKLTPINGTFNEQDTVKSLDASILQDNLLAPILGIKDPRTNERIEFVGGIRGLEELERRVNEGMTVAFSLYRTSVKDIVQVADEGHVMPPKSTWFEPKLRSGLFIHSLE